MRKLLPLLTTVCLAAAACNQGGTKGANDSTSTSDSLGAASVESIAPAAGFDTTIDGKKVKLFYLKNSNGVEMAVTNYGAKVVSLLTPDKDGKKEDIVLGFSDLKGYLGAKEEYYGGVVGRYGNRIAKGKFKLDGKEYTLFTNNGVNTLHGGKKGYNEVVWDAEQKDPKTIVFHYLSPDGEEGYPGNLDITMTYELTDNNEFRITYGATTDKPTVVNITHHSFFNLHGAGNGSVNDHVLSINADYFTPVDSTLIPLGKNIPVKGTPFDFTQPTAIGSRIEQADQQLKFGKGYDHNWVLNKKGDSLTLAATVLEPASGRYMEVWTTEPGVQFYGGNFIDGSDKGKGKVYNFRGALCLETQHFPDSPNQPGFPSTVLKPGQTYKHVCIYKFDVKK